MERAKGASTAKSGKSWLYGFMLFLCFAAAGAGSYFAYIFSHYSDFDTAAEHIEVDERAYRDAGWAWESKDIIEAPPSPQEDGDPLFSAAAKSIRALQPAPDPSAILDLINKEQFQAADKLLKPMVPALRLVQAATEKKSFDLGIDPDRFGDGGTQAISLLHYFVRVLCLKARCDAGIGNNPGAIQDIKTAWKLGVRASRMPSTTAIMVGYSSEALALSEIEIRAASWINHPDLRKALSDLISSPSDLPDLKRLYQVHAYEGLASFRNFEHPIDGLASAGEIPGATSGPGIARTHPNTTIRTGLPTDPKSRAYAARHFQLWCEVGKAINTSPNDPIALARALRGIADKWSSRQTGSAMLAGIEGTALPEFATAIGRIRAQALVTRAILAAMDVRSKSGTWPSEISQIPGEWDDPFCHKPLHLKLRGGGIRIYSLGPDMTDDGGTRRDEIKPGQNPTAYDIVASYPPFVPKRI